MRLFTHFQVTRLLGGIKAAAYVAALSLATLAVSARAARGALGEVSLSLARQLNEVPDLIGSTKLIELNGQPFRVSTAVVPLSADKVLDRFSEACGNHPGELARLAASYGLEQSKVPSPAKGRAPLVRQDGDGDGVLGCLLESSSAVKGSMSDVVREFGRSRDASVFGDFLVVYAKDQSGGKSHVVAVWTRGPFKVLDLFPAKGDAPGSDSALIGRPNGSRRLLSGSAEDAPYGIHIYESSEAPASLLEGFSRDIQGRGWHELPAQALGQSRAFQHSSGILALLTAGSNAGKTTIAVLEMGNGDFNATAPR